MYDYNRMSGKRAKRLNRIRIKKKVFVCCSKESNIFITKLYLAFFNAYELGHEKKTRVLYEQ